MLPVYSTTEHLYSTFGGDPDLGELVESFVARLPDRRQTLGELFAAENWLELQRAAHQLKGAAGSYGFDELTDVAARLELVVKSRDEHAAISRALESVVACCERCRSGVAG